MIRQRKPLVVLLICLLLVPALPEPSDAGLFGFLVRAFIGRSVRRAAVGGVWRSLTRSAVRGGLRSMARGAGRRMIRSQARSALQRAEARRLVVHRGQERMRKILSQRAFDIRDQRGRVIGKAALESDVLVFRAQGRRVAFAQWEKNGLHLYRANGQRVARITDQDGRVLVYDERGRYLGQFIEDLVEDQVVEFFVDALGNRHEQLYLGGGYPGLEIPESERHYSYSPAGESVGFSAIREGVLYVYDAEGGELIRGVLEEGLLVLYDAEGEVRGSFRLDGERIVALDESGSEVGYIQDQDGKALYFEAGTSEPSAWVEL